MGGLSGGAAIGGSRMILQSSFCCWKASHVYLCCDGISKTLSKFGSIDLAPEKNLVLLQAVQTAVVEARHACGDLGLCDAARRLACFQPTMLVMVAGLGFSRVLGFSSVSGFGA